MKKQLYKGTFNWHGEVHIMYRYATEATAYDTLVRALAKRLGRVPSAVRIYFNGTVDNFKIEREEKK
jgi:hypothetical protein